MVTAAAIRKFHMAPKPNGNAWDDIGYHYVITPWAEIQAGRPVEFVGAHCKGHNNSSIGVCLGGLSEFPRKQLKAMRYFLHTLMLQYDLTEDDVWCHYMLDTVGKTCPNLNVHLVRAYLEDFKCK